MDNDIAIEHSPIHRDDTASKMGMWLFLFTELILFGGMFILYASYRFMHSDEFKVAALRLDTTIGTINTIILLTSSLTVVLSIAALQRKHKMLSIYFINTTIILGSAFLVNKYFEWATKIQHGIYQRGPEMALAMHWMRKGVRQGAAGVRCLRQQAEEHALKEALTCSGSPCPFA